MGLTAIFFVAMFTAGVIMTLAGRTIVGLYLYFVTLYFHAPSQWWGEGLPDLRWSLIAALVTACSLLLYPPEKPLKFWAYTENKLITLLMALVLAQQFWVARPDVHSEYVVLLAKFMLLIFLIQNMAISSREIKGIIYANIFGTAYLAYYGMSMNSAGRMENIGNGWDSNLIAMHFAAMLFLGGYALLEKFRWTHLLVMAALAIILMGLFRTESRGALLAMGLTGGLCLLFRPQRDQSKFLLFVGLAVLAASMLMGPQIIERFQGMKSNGDGEMQDKSAQSRIVIILDQIEMWKDAPVLGHGHRGTLLLSPSYVDEEFQTEGGVRASHNVAMSFLVDHGIVGFVLYFSAIISCLVKIFGKNAPAGMEISDERNFYSNTLIGCCAALFCFMLGGMGADNKKLEADVWLMALIPLLYARLQMMDASSSQDAKPEDWTYANTGPGDEYSHSSTEDEQRV